MAEHVAISHSTPAEFVRELTGHDSRLDVVSLDEEPARLRSVFTSSYRKLREEDARLFRLLSLYPGDAVSTEAAAALAGTGIRLAAASLARLTEASLVDCPRRNHVVMHDLLREFAAERAEHDDTREARQRATLRFLDWYLHSWDHADRVLDPNRRRLPLSPPAEGTPHLEFDDLVSAFAWCEAERTTLVAAILFAAGNGHGVHAWQLTWCAWTFFDRGKHWRDWITTHTTALAVTRESGDRFAESRILTGLALAYQHRRQHPEALDCLTRSLHITRDLGDRYYEAVNLYCLGGALLVDGDTEAALARFGQALALREEIADRHGESLTLAAIGRALRATDRIDEAILYFERSLVIRRALHDRHGEGTTLNNLGEAHLTRGRYSHATHYLRQALDIRREVQDRWGVARTLRHLGQALLSAGQPIADVVEHWTEALETFNALGDDPQSEAVRDMLRALVDANTPTEPPRAANHHLANRETQPDPQERTL
jgi:tetratricopeptide (TPR) repeat protein